MIKQNPQIFDHFADGYDLMATHRHRYDFFLNNFSQQRSAALEVGCGGGSLAFALSTHYASVVAFDLSGPLLAIAQHKRHAPNLTYVQMDVNHLGLAAKFDLIASHTTFHHLPNIPTVLQTLQALLRPGGRLIIVDSVCETHKIAWPVLLASPLRDFLYDYHAYGPRVACRLLRFRLSPAWLAHLVSDTFLSAREFCDLYGQALPNSRFVRLGNQMGVIWESPYYAQT